MELSAMSTAIERAVTVLDLAARQGGSVRFGEIVQLLGDASETTVSRLLQLLVTSGVLHKDRREGYRLSSKVQRWAAAAPQALNLRDLARPALEQVHRELQVTVALATVRDGQHICLDRIAHDDSPSLAVPGRTRPNIAILMGACFFASDEQLQSDAFYPAEVNGRPLHASREEQRALCRRWIEAGVMVDSGLWSLYMTRVCLPIFRRGQAIACITAAMPRARYENEPDFAANLTSRLRQLTDELSALVEIQDVSV